MGVRKETLGVAVPGSTIDDRGLGTPGLRTPNPGVPGQPVADRMTGTGGFLGPSIQEKKSSNRCARRKVILYAVSVNPRIFEDVFEARNGGRTMGIGGPEGGARRCREGRFRGPRTGAAEVGVLRPSAHALIDDRGPGTPGLRTPNPGFPVQPSTTETPGRRVSGHPIPASRFNHRRPRSIGGPEGDTRRRRSGVNRRRPR